VTSCEDGNEYSGSIRCLCFYWPAKRISASQGSYSVEVFLVIYLRICSYDNRVFCHVCCIWEVRGGNVSPARQLSLQ